MSGHPSRPDHVIEPSPAKPEDLDEASRGEDAVPSRSYPEGMEPADGEPAPPQRRTGVKDRGLKQDRRGDPLDERGED